MKEVSENYLKYLFVRQQAGETYIKPASLSKKFNVSAAAVSEMLKKLSDQGLILYVPYQGISLTDAGLAQGQNMVRRHRLWEQYLHEKLGFAWDKVHEEAEMLEHASSDALINALEEALGFPEFDPHGDPIPAKDGSIPKSKPALPLSSCTEGMEVEVVRVSDFDEEFLAYIQDLGIGLGTRLKVQHTHRFDHSIVINLDHKVISLSHFSAEHLFVVEQKP
ncbi:MAG: metal-dependent transcriptional regulator [Candidatus Margulisiibacteriota bacterium]